MKRILCLFFAVLMIASVFSLNIFAQSNDNSTEYVDMSKTSIAYDFEFLFASQYKVDKFTENSKAEGCQYICAMECLNKDANKYDLYIYVYNPSRLVIEKNSDKNSILLANYYYTTKGQEDENNYNKMALSFVSDYSDELSDEAYTNGLILKFKASNLLDYNKSLIRVYRAGDVELLEEKMFVPVSFIAGKELRFFNAAEHLNVNRDYIVTTVNDLLTVEVDAFHTYYRVNTDTLNKYNDIQSVYFPVANGMLETYGSVYSMELVWDVYKTNNFIASKNIDATSYINNSIYGNMQNDRYSVVYGDEQYVGASLYTYSHFINLMRPFQLYRHDRFRGLEYDIVGRYDYGGDNGILGDFDVLFDHDFADNSECVLDPVLVECPCQSKDVFDISLVGAFYSTKVDINETKILDGDTIVAFFNTHKNDNNGELYREVEKNKATFTIKDYKTSLKEYELSSKWKAFWKTYWTQVPTGDKIEFKPFLEIDTNDLKNMTAKEFSEKYLVDEEDVKCTNSCGECMTCRVNDKKYANCKWYLLRYDVTDYQCYNALLLDNKTNFDGKSQEYLGEAEKAVVFNTSVIDMFDTINIGFEGVSPEGAKVYSVFPIGRSPSQYASDVFSPEDTGKLFGGAKSAWEKFLIWMNEKLIPFLKIVAFAIMVITVLRIVIPLLPKRVKVKQVPPDERKKK